MTQVSQAVKNIYQGDGATVNMSIPFEFSVGENAEVVVVKFTAGGAPALQVEGALQDYTLTGGNPALGVNPTIVTFNSAPTGTDFILVIRVTPDEQEFDPTVAWSSTSLMASLDIRTRVSLEHDEQLSRVPMLPRTTRKTLPIVLEDPPATDAMLYWDHVTNAYRWVAPSAMGITWVLVWDKLLNTPVWASPGTLLAAAGAAGVVGIPTDTLFGATGGVTGILSADTIADGFDKVEVVLEKLAPAKPANLSTLAMEIVGSYSAKQASTGAAHTCTSSTTPIARPTANAPFYDGDSGTLSAEVDAVSVGSRILTAASDVGVYTNLEILTDVDPYAGIFGQQNFWKQLTARIQAAVLSLGLHTAQLKHSTTGNAAAISFYVDDPGTTTISGRSATFGGSTSTISGVPGAASGQAIVTGWTVDGAVATHYNATQVGRATSSQTNTINLNPGSPPANGASVAFAAQNLTVAGGAYSETVQVVFSGFNSSGVQVSSTLTTAIRVDTVSSEAARAKSGTGQYPTIGAGAAQFGGAFSSSTLLTAANNEELQMLNGIYQYPPAVSYAAKFPAGPDYSAVAGGSFSNYRWVTFNTGAIAALSSITITLNGAVNIAGLPTTGLAIQVLVDGATPTTGWVDANAAYSGVGNPTANGDPACVIASSTATSRRVTFGAAPKTGNCWVRIGYPSGSTKQFTGVTRT